MQWSNREENLRFIDRVQRLLERVDYRPARTAEEKDAIFCQRYGAYLREGAIEPNPTARFTDHYDQTDNVQIFGLYIEDRLCASMRLHFAVGMHRFIPALWAFSDILIPELDAGRRILDPTRFVVDYEASRLYPELAYLTARLGWIAGEFYQADLILAIVRAEHQAFYRRVFNYRLVADCRPYPTLKKPMSLLFLDYPQQKEIVEARYPFLKSTEEERGALFRPLPGSERAAA